MASLSDLIRQAEFLKAGGRPEGARDIDKIQSVFQSIAGLGTTLSDISKKVLEKKMQEMQIAGLERSKMKLGERFPALKTEAPVTATAGVEEVVTKPEKLEKQKREDIFGIPISGMTLDEFKEAATIEKTLREKNPLDTTPMVVTKVWSDITGIPEGTPTTYGELKQAAALKRAETISQTKPLSGEASKIFSIATTLPDEIEQLKEAFRNDYAGAVYGIVIGTDRRLVKLVDQVADKVGRLRSGGAINKEEEARFKRQIASAMDIPFGKEGDAISALDGILKEAESVAKSIRPKTEISKPQSKIGKEVSAIERIIQRTGIELNEESKQLANQALDAGVMTEDEIVKELLKEHK